MTFTAPFPAWLHQKRIDAGLTASQLAKKMRCSDRAIHQYESGDRVPSLSMSESYAKALGVSVAELYGEAA